MTAELWMIFVLIGLIIFQQMYWSTIVFKLTNRLMSKDFYAYKQAEMVGKPKASKAPSEIEAAIDPMDERQANEMNSILGMV